MTHRLTPDLVIKTCTKCGAKLKDIIAYIPDLGEVCMKCYKECAQEKELITRLPRTRDAVKDSTNTL
jgi:hypothetical protein